MSTQTSSQDLDTQLDEASLPEKTVEVCLRGDLVAQVEDLERELRDLRTNTETMADQGRARKVAERIEAARAEMSAKAIVFRFRGLDRHGWAQLLTDCPPRDGVATDKALGYNPETFYPALIRRCLVEPQVTDEQWERLDARLSSGQFDSLADTALAVSRRKVDVPFSFAASATLRSSAETSPPQSV